MSDNLVAQPRLRWVSRRISEKSGEWVLQQWWAQDLPSYMRDVAKGEWRDIPIEVESG